MTQTTTAVLAGPRRPVGSPLPPPAAAPARPASAPAGRFGWLDALRGFAALLVVYHHLAVHVLGQPRRLLGEWLNLGRYGVLLFFLVSGYVIAMSMQRYGSLRRFWIGRIFRIYPAYLVAAAAMALLIASGVQSLYRGLHDAPATAALAHVSMLQELLGVPSFVYVYWTLSYEMVFYLLVSGLFVLGLHRRCGWWALALALITVAAGGLLPDALFGAGAVAARPVTVVTTLLMVGSLAAYLRGHRRPACVAAVAGLALIALPVANGSAVPGGHVHGSFQAMTFLTAMFAGMVVFAGQHAQLSRRTAVLTLAAVLACLLAAAWWHAPRPGQSAATVDGVRSEAVGTLLAVAATFALAFALRHRRVPRWLTWPGTVSYSVYLLHPIVLYLLRHWTPGVKRQPFVVEVAVGAGFLAVVLLVSWVSYRLVERPGQDLGRRVGRALDARLGPDRSTASALARPGR